MKNIDTSIETDCRATDQGHIKSDVIDFICGCMKCNNEVEARARAFKMVGFNV